MFDSRLFAASLQGTLIIKEGGNGGKIVAPAIHSNHLRDSFGRRRSENKSFSFVLISFSLLASFRPAAASALLLEALLKNDANIIITGHLKCN